MRNEEEVLHRLNELRGKLLRLKEIVNAKLGSRVTRLERAIVEAKVDELEWVLQEEWQKPADYRG